jgi:chemotaxis signal transduction protein
MLHGGLSEKENRMAYFINRDGVILSSTDPSRPPGARLELDSDLLALENGESASRIIIHDDNYKILGCTASSGYREFKVSDGYHEDVLAVVLHSFGSVRTHKELSNKDKATQIAMSVDAKGLEFATFFVHGSLYALPAGDVMEALPAAEISSVSLGSHTARIGLLAQQHTNEDKKYVWVFDLGYLLRGIPSIIDSASQVIIVRHGSQTIGLLVSELHGVPQFDPALIVASPIAGKALVTHVIKANNGELLIQSINTTCLFDQLLGAVEKQESDIVEGSQLSI